MIKNISSRKQLPRKNLYLINFTNENHTKNENECSQVTRPLLEDCLECRLDIINIKQSGASSLLPLQLLILLFSLLESINLFLNLWRPEFSRIFEEEYRVDQAAHDDCYAKRKVSVESESFLYCSRHTHS